LIQKYTLEQNALKVSYTKYYAFNKPQIARGEGGGRGAGGGGGWGF